MLQQKQIYVANFNCTFGKENEPMLDYFLDIIYPAFKESEEISKDPNRKDFLVFENILLTMKNGTYVLGGLIVKRTELEVKSNYDENGTLQPTNDLIPAAPYSFFMINLKNHRMTIVKNQKGSPTLKDFEKAASKILKDYVRIYNKERNKEEKLPSPHLDVVSMPNSATIKEELKKIKKIEKLNLKFFPKNKDVSTNETFEYLSSMLERTGSKNGNTQILTPKNHKEVGELIDETKGMVRPVLYVQYKDNRRRTLRDNDFSETSSIELDDETSFGTNLDIISGKVINQEEYKHTSEENNKLYDKYYPLLEDLYKKE